MQQRRLAILYAKYGPYHLARLQAATRMGQDRGWQVVGIELASQQLVYPWETGAAGHAVQKYTVFSQRAVEEIPTLRQWRGMWSLLNRVDPQALAFPGFRNPGMQAALIWASLKRRPALALMASKADDYPRYPVKEWAKRRIMSLYAGVIAAGTLAGDYAFQLGIPRERIFVGNNVVDNELFIREAQWARENAPQLRKKYRLPEDYFLCVSRFMEKKNLPRLIQAYARYREITGAQAWDLVICGSGPLESRLRQQVQLLGLKQVHFPGFKQIDELPNFYGLARCFIIPSSHAEQFGLVVNEAMAAGLPVLVSRACGCAPDLVREGVNGFTFDPLDVEAMASLMVKMSSGEVDLAAMSRASGSLIARWTPEAYAENLFKAVAAAEKTMGCYFTKQS
jgi:1,2-diacylglycerol 3-alpha-glucosyltransferase